MLLLAYSFVAGLLGSVPSLSVLHETIRILYFHVPMWFGMVIFFGISAIYSTCYLRTRSSKKIKYWFLSFSFAKIAFLFGVMGIITGMIWARFTWGTAWHNDPKQTCAALSLLIYATYFLLSAARGQTHGSTEAAYNIICFFTMLPLLFILPRMTDSLHPGSGGNPGFNVYDLDGRLRQVFYPAVVGWALLGVWMAGMEARIYTLERHMEDLRMGARSVAMDSP